jgi:hypothetical protein
VRPASVARVNEREWLLRRIEIEALAYANSDQTVREIRWGRVLGFIEVGVAFGFWSKRAADGAANVLGHRYGVRRVRRLLNRDR